LGVLASSLFAEEPRATFARIQSKDDADQRNAGASSCNSFILIEIGRRLHYLPRSTGNAAVGVFLLIKAKYSP
jgi:hypothetical protein